MVEEGQHESLWIATAPGAPRAPLAEDIETDVAIVGGGIVGLLSAYLLQKEGRKVTVLERGDLVRGVTGHSTAKVTSQHGLCYSPMVKRFGEDKARMHGEANEQAKETIAAIVKELDIDCGFTQAPAYVYATDAKELQQVQDEATVAQRLGLPASFVTDTELPFPVEGAVRFDAQAHFHPRRFLQGVADAIVQKGGQVYEQTPVTQLEDGRPCRLTSGGHAIAADEVIVATNVPVNDRAYFTPRMEPNRQYGAAFSVDAASLQGMYISAGQPIRSVRPYEGEDGPMLVFVGEKHHVGGETATTHHYDDLVSFARQSFRLGDLQYRWSTQDYYPVDGVPFIGRYSPTSKHMRAATGFRAWGMTMGAVAAMMFAHELGGRETPWSAVYDPYAPGRVVKDLVDPQFLKMQGKVAEKFVTERLVEQEARSLAPGEGQIAEVDGEKLAIHRDRSGALHAHQARCTHMGCFVAWNQAEQSWDCPCHGSRFAGDGAVLHGPATAPLEKASMPAKQVP